MKSCKIIAEVLAPCQCRYYRAGQEFVLCGDLGAVTGVQFDQRAG